MSTSAFTTLHVALSLIGIATGLFVLAGLLRSQMSAGVTATFLATTVLTSATGFLFPGNTVLPSHVVGTLSLAVLAAATLALYSYRLAGPWRWIYVAAAVSALYLNVFVLVAQAFQKVPILNQLAPAPWDPPFVIAQLLVLATFVVLGVKAARSFHVDVN